MEERLDFPMTDNQWNGIIKMVMVLLSNYETSSEAIEALKVLLRNEDAAEVEEKIEKLKARRKETAGR